MTMAGIEQIKDAIDLCSLISESCKLDSNGRGAHENKHDSKSGTCLYVSDDWWYCHHCHASGDVLDWIMDRDNVDFPEALRTAAEIAGISLDGIDSKAESDRRAVFDVLKAAAVHFHENLTDAHRADISDRWGITNETIDKLLIGIARNDEALEVYLKQRGFTHDQIIKSGLFFDWNNMLKPHFQGRYVFPYWKNGTVRYMIARWTKHTPKGKYEEAKYKKLLTHNDKHPYVSEHVRNDTLYGVDSLRGVSDWCLVTEGVTDCIMAYQAGIPCISPVTVTFKKTDHKQILKLVKRLETVYICNDNEDNEAGLDGAIRMAEHLEANGISTKLITLPRPDGVEKIDLAEYLRDHAVDEFRTLFNTAVSVWNVKLSRQPVGDDTVENVKTAKRFITDGLSGMDAAERVAFTESGIKAHFKLSDDAIKELVKTTPSVSHIFTVSPDDFLVGDRKVFDVNGFAKWLVFESGRSFRTLSDTEEVLRYEDGVYLHDGDIEIGKLVEQIMDGFKVTKNAVNEIIGHVRRRTYTERKEFDNNNNIINLKNGLYDMKTDELKPHTPEYLSLQKSPIVYDPAATCPRIGRFFREVLLEKHVVFMYELFGYALLKEKRLDTAVLFEGTGANGKSRMIELLNAFVGSDVTAHVTPSELSGDDKFATADLFGKLLNTIDDLGNTPLKNLGVFKSVISGAEQRGQNKYEKAFKFTPMVLCVFGCNEVPVTTDTSDGFFRRMITVPFLQQFDGDKADKNLFGKLTTQTELSGLFNMAMKAISEMKEIDAFTCVGTIDDRKQAYLYASNPVAKFCDECCDFSDPDDYISKNELYNQYVIWSRDNCIRVKTKGVMTTYLEGVGCVVRQLTGDDNLRYRAYVGVRIKEGE